MARKRMIDPEFWLDEELSQLSAYARLLYIGLWGICDDNFATLPNKPGWIKAQVFPYNQIEVDVLIGELVESKKILPFIVDGNGYFYLKNFHKHQRIDKPSAAKYPQYTGTLGESSYNPLSEVKGSEVKRKEDNLSRSEALQFNKNIFDYFIELTGENTKDDPKDRQKYPRLIRNKFKDFEVVKKAMYWAWNQRRKSDNFYYWREGRMTLAKLYHRIIPDFMSNIEKQTQTDKLAEMKSKLMIKPV